MRKLLPLALAVTLTATLVPQPAQAAKRPGRVEGAHASASSTASTTLSWRKVKRAKKYVIERVRTNKQQTRTRKVLKVEGSTRKRSFTVRGLKQGKQYCHRIRPQGRKKRFGIASPPVCKNTIRTEGRGTGPAYNVVTYNVCAVPCASRNPGTPWSSRIGTAGASVRALAPDVVAIQEGGDRSGMVDQLPGFSAAISYRGKELIYRSARFREALSPFQEPRAGVITLSAPGANPRFAVWAELEDRTFNNQSTIFVSLHLTSGDTAATDKLRQAEIARLHSGLLEINPDKRPVVIAGDFNANQWRAFDNGSVRMRAAGFTDAFYMSRAYVQPHEQSAYGGVRKPPRPIRGQHLDQVWVDANRTRVLNWRNGARVNRKGKYLGTLASDHSPILVRVQLDAG